MEEIKVRIFQAARQSGVSKFTLRDLERHGVVHPSRSVAGHRLYSEADLQKIREHYEKKKRSNWVTNWGEE